MPILGVIASSRQVAVSDTGSYFAINSFIVPSSGSASVTFSSIPSTYTHLQIRGVAKSNRAVYVDDLGIRFNGVSTNSYSWHRMYTFGSGTGQADAGTTQNHMNVAQIAGGTVNLANGMGGFVIDILDYTSTNKSKTVRALSGYSDNGQGACEVASGAFQVSNTAISSITLLPLIGTSFNQFSEFTLYGVKA